MSSLIKYSPLLFLMAGCSSGVPPLPYYNTPDFEPHFLSGQSEVNAQIDHVIGDFSFTDQNGTPITQHDIEDRIHVANFMFTTCPGICPVMTDHMKSISEEFAGNEDVVMLSFSVTPWIDSVERLQEYTRAREIDDPNWHFLTGAKSDIYQLARQSYFAEEDIGFTRDSTEFLHTEHILLVDRNKHIRGIYNGTLLTDIHHLIEDIHTLLTE